MTLSPLVHAAELSILETPSNSNNPILGDSKQLVEKSNLIDDEKIRLSIPAIEESRFNDSTLNPNEEDYIGNEGNVLGIETRIGERVEELNAFYTDLEKEIEEIRTRRHQANRLKNYLALQGSPIATYEYADMIIRISAESGIDYRIIVALMGIESGFCAVPVSRS